MNTSREFRIGDCVRIANQDDIHVSWHGRTGIVSGCNYNITRLAVSMDDVSETLSWWSPSSLVFIGTEESIAEETLGEDYFA